MQKFTIRDPSGLSVDLSDFGARIIGIDVPGKDTHTQLACRLARLEDYAADQSYLGASVGPIANRVADGQLVIENRHYQLPRNHGRHSLHSGALGFDKINWRCLSQTPDSIEFLLHFPEHPQVLPGNLQVTTRYSVSDRQLRIDYRAISDRATYLNLTNHVYLNLDGEGKTIHDHEFTIYADGYAELDADKIPTGKVVPIRNPLRYCPAGESAYPDLRGQLDHHFIVDEDTANPTMRRFARISSPASAIKVLVSGTAPGFQAYTGQFLSAPLQPFAGFCIEPQFVPNAINRAEFASPLTTPQSPFRSTTTLDFSWPV